ncbi:DUF6518 family protein [Dactylosporangium siamense]|uniref:Uncharacterized protein n=1 Tax=Dactylosporangium siamense TaxID=685454 RepID=A0A919Q015_9ACTN|nr:DUF6518 family protein [Dactylosporangium siamense]GIG51708.1 hypothetical protein Dsi01nite_097490 [Dactylosporangium siamense]
MYGRAALAGLVLGVLAFAADHCHGLLAVAMVLVSSSGLAWGAAALVLAFAAANERTGVGGRRAAAGAAVTVLAVATLVYYGVIVVDGDRWRGGTLDDGSSADAMALRSIATATAFWLAASAAGGVVLGLLGHAIRRSGPRAAAVAAGAAGALLAGQAALRLIQMSGYDQRFLSELAPWAAETAAEVALAAVLSVALLRRGAHRPHWGWYAAATVTLLAVALAGWSVVETVRATGY